MKFPFVYRGEYEALKTDRDNWRRFYETAQAAYERLHAATMAPRVATTPAPVDAPPREPSLIAQVIQEQAGGDPRLARHLRTYAGKLTREGMHDEQVAHELTRWHSTEPEILS